MYSTRQRSRSPFIEGTRLPSRSTLQSYRNVRNSSLSGHSSNYKSESSFASLSPSFRRVRDLDLGVSDATFRRQSRTVERLPSEMPDRFLSPSRPTVLRPPPTSFFKETCESPTRFRELRSYSPASVPTSIETRQPRSLPHPSVPVVKASSEFYSARRRLEGDSDIPVSSSNTKSDVLFDIPSRSPRSLSSIRTTPSYRMPVSHVNFKDYYRPPIRERPIIRSDYVPRSRADRERTNMPIVRERRMIKFREMSKDIMNNVKRRISWVMPDDLGSPMIENLSANRERDEQLTEDLFNNRSRESSASRIRSTDNSVGRMRSREVSPTRTNSPKSAERSVQSMEANFNRLRSPRHSLEPQNMTQCVVETVPTPHRRHSKEIVGLKGIKSVKSKSTLNERRFSGENGVKLMNNEVDVQQLHRRKNSTADDKSCKPDISVDHTGHPRSRRRRRETPPAVEEENSSERSRRRVRGVPLDYVRCHSRKSAEISKEVNVASAVDAAEVPKSEKFSEEFVNHIPMCYANLDGGDGYSSKVTQECSPVEEKHLPPESAMPSKGKQSKIGNSLLAEREKSDLKKCVPIVPKKDEEKRMITTGLTTAKFTGKSKDISKIKVGDSTNRGDISIIGKEVKICGDAVDGQGMLLSKQKSNVSTKTTFPNRHDSAPDTQNTSKVEEQSNRAIKGISQRYIGVSVANSGKEPENAVTHKSQSLYIEKADTASNSHPSENKLPIADDHVKKVSKINVHDKNSTGSEESRKLETLGKTSRKPPGRSISTEVIKSFDAPTVGDKSKSSEACSENTVKMNILNKNDTKCKQYNALHNEKDGFLNGIATLAPKDRGSTANSVTGKDSKEISASLPKRTLLDEAPKISLVKDSVTKNYVNSLESNLKCVAETVATGESKATENFVKSNASAAKIAKSGFPKTAAGPEVISTKNVYTSNSVRDSKKPDSPKGGMQISKNKCIETMNENNIILAETSTDRIETAVDENDTEGKRSALSQGNKFISDARKVLPVLNDETKGKISNEIRGKKEEYGDATLGVAVLRREPIDEVKRVAGHTKVEDKMKAQTFTPKDGSSFIFMKDRYPKGVEDDGNSHSKTVSITKEIVKDIQRDALSPKTEIADNIKTPVSLKCIAKTPVEGNIPGTYGIPLSSVGDKNKTHDARGIKDVQSTGKEEHKSLAVVTQTESKNEVPVSHILKCVPRFKADTATAGSVNGSGTVVENLDEPRQRTVLESAFSERDDMVKPDLLSKAGDEMGSKVISSFARDSCTDSGTKTGLPKEIPVVTVKNNGVYQEKSVNIAQKIVLEDFVSRKANADVSKSNVDLKNKFPTVKRIEESLSERNALSDTRPWESHVDQVKAQPGIEIRPKHPDDSYLSDNKTAAKFADADKRDHALVKNGKESGLILKDHGGVAADSETASQGARHTSKPESFDKGTPHNSNNSILISSENLEEGKGDLSPGSRGSGREHYNITIKTKSEGGVKEHSDKIMNMDSNVAKLVPKGKEVNVSLRNGDFVNKDHPEYPKNTAVLEDSSLALNPKIDSSHCMETKSDNRHDASMGRDFVKESDVSIEVRLNLAGAARSPGLIVPEKTVSTNFTIKLPKEPSSEVPKSLKKVVDSDVVKVNYNTKDKQREEKQPVFSEKSLPSCKVDSEKDSEEDSKSDSSEDSESDSSEDSEDDSSSSSSESRLDNERNNYLGNGQKQPRRFIGLVTRAMPLLYHDLKQGTAPPTACSVNCHQKCEKHMPNLCGVNQKLLSQALDIVKKGRLSDCERKSNSETSFSLSEDTSEKSQPPKLRFRKYTIDDFQFIKLLGKGSYGKVLLAELKGQNSYFAVKCLKKDFMLDDVESTMIERRVLALGTQHPYMCKLYCTFQTDSYLFFVMEYLNGGDLMFHIQESRKFDIDRARFYGAEIVSALKFLHKRGIVYRDIKLDNVVMDEQGHVRLVDFGMCQCRIYKEECRPYNFCGTPTYIAPEILMGQTYNQSVDWWSFGVLLFEMLNGRSPFKGTDEDELFWSVCNEEPYYPRFLCKEAIDILQQLLIKSPTERLGMPTCTSGDITEHAFFSPIDWVKLEMKQIQPPFKPSVRFATDTSNFDSTFTMDSATLTPVESDILHSMDQEQFRGFSYTNPHITN